MHRGLPLFLAGLGLALASMLAVPPPDAPAAIPDLGVAVTGQPSDEASQLDLAKRAGMSWVMLTLDWDWYEPTADAYLAPSGPGRESWEELGRRLDAARARGLRVMVIFKRTPRWARATANENDGPTPAAFADYATFMGDVARTYGSKIDAYGTWNEPNIDLFWRQPDAAQYARLHRLATAQIRRYDRQAPVVLGPFAGNAANSFTFLKRLYRNGVKGTANRIGWNSYPVGAPQVFSNQGSALSSQFRLAKLLRRLDPGRKVWLTEVGWSTCRCPAGSPNVVSARTQGEYLLGTLSYVRRYLRGSVDRLFIYNMKDGRDPRRWGSNQGLLYNDLRPKPAFQVIKRSPALLRRPKAAWRRQRTSGATRVSRFRLYSRKGEIIAGATVGMPASGRVQVFGHWRGRWRLIENERIARGGALTIRVSDIGYRALRLRARANGSSRWAMVQMPVPNGPRVRS